MSDSEETKGQLIVGKYENPDNIEVVDQVKTKVAELIDLYEGLKVDGISAEKESVFSTAQKEAEMSLLFVVEAVYTN